MAEDTEATRLWDDSIASDLVGKLLLIGITFTDAEGKPENHEQSFGRVTRVDQQSGIALRLEGSREGDVFNLPPDTRSFRPAARGAYRLRASGEVVTDPDYTVTFLVHRGEYSE